MLHSFRLKALNPDFRRVPKTEIYCCICQRDIKGQPQYQARVIDGCSVVVHPNDVNLIPKNYPDDFGELPVGGDCAKK